MTKPSRRNRSKSLPNSLGRVDLPIQSRLNLVHAEKVCMAEGKKMFSPTATNLLYPLLAQSSSSSTVLRGFQCKLELNNAPDFKYWFVFDRGYRLFEHKSAMDMTPEQLRVMTVVTSYPRSIYAGIAAMYLVRGEDDLQILMQRSPIFGWLSMFAGSQNPDETWIYFFRPHFNPGKGMA